MHFLVINSPIQMKTPQLFKGWITQRTSLVIRRWIVIYPLDTSAIV